MALRTASFMLMILRRQVESAIPKVGNGFNFNSCKFCTVFAFNWVYKWTLVLGPVS